jgi:hypothetical protein
MYLEDAIRTLTLGFVSLMRPCVLALFITVFLAYSWYYIAGLLLGIFTLTASVMAASIFASLPAFQISEYFRTLSFVVVIIAGFIIIYATFKREESVKLIDIAAKIFGNVVFAKKGGLIVGFLAGIILASPFVLSTFVPFLMTSLIEGYAVEYVILYNVGVLLGGFVIPLILNVGIVRRFLMKPILQIVIAALLITYGVWGLIHDYLMIF